MSGTPENGQIAETVTRRRIIPAAKANQPISFWEYASQLTPDDWCTPGGTPKHTLYLYRDEPAPSVSLAKCTTAVFPDTNTPWADQEEMEIALMQRYGGGRFRIILKRGSERVCVHSFNLAGSPKAVIARAPDVPQMYPNQYGTGPQVNPAYPNSYNTNPYDGTARVAETAIHTMANQEQAGVRLALDSLATTANIVKSFAERPAGPPQDDITRQLLAVALQRMMAPPPDPLDLLTKVLALQAQMNPSGGSVPPALQKVLDVAIEKVLNPPAPSGPAVSMGAELVRTLPSIAQYVTQGLGDYARIMEAQRDAIALQRSAQPGQVLPPPQRPPAAPPAPPAPIAKPPNGESMLTDPMVFIEQKIVEILNEPQSAEWAAEEALNFLDRMDPNIVPQLCQQGEPGLMSLFQTRPTLKPALNNPARLSEFIRAFLKYASENGGEAQEVKPN